MWEPGVHYVLPSRDRSSFELCGGLGFLVFAFHAQLAACTSHEEIMHLHIVDHRATPVVWPAAEVRADLPWSEFPNLPASFLEITKWPCTRAERLLFAPRAGVSIPGHPALPKGSLLPQAQGEEL